METLLASLTLPVAVLLAAGFAAAIVSLFCQETYDPLSGPRKQKGAAAIVTGQWGQYFGDAPKPAAPAIASAPAIKLAGIDAFEKVRKAVLK